MNSFNFTLPGKHKALSNQLCQNSSLLVFTLLLGDVMVNPSPTVLANRHGLHLPTAVFSSNFFGACTRRFALWPEQLVGFPTVLLDYNFNDKTVIFLSAAQVLAILATPLPHPPPCACAGLYIAEGRTRRKWWLSVPRPICCCHFSEAPLGRWPSHPAAKMPRIMIKGGVWRNTEVSPPFPPSSALRPLWQLLRTRTEVEEPRRCPAGFAREAEPGGLSWPLSRARRRIICAPQGQGP